MKERKEVHQRQRSAKTELRISCMGCLSTMGEGRKKKEGRIDPPVPFYITR